MQVTKRMITQNKIDETARLWNETKNPKYKKQWYQLIYKLYGSNIIKRWTISSGGGDKGNGGRHRTFE
jgi:hypothetical protein